VKAFLKNSVKFTVYSNLWIALSAAALTFSSLYIFDFPLVCTNDTCNYLIPVFAFSATLAGYSWLRILSVKFSRNPSNNDRHVWLKRHLSVVWISFIAGLAGAAASFPALSWRQQAIASVAGLITAFYGIPFKAFRQKAIREIPYVKIFLISLCWVGATVLLPISSVQSEHVWLFAAAQFLFIFGITIPFDIRDLKTDSHGKFTLAQFTGIRIAKMISILLLATAIGLYFLMPISILKIAALSFPLLVAAPLCLKAHPLKPELYYTGLLDGIMILQGILVLLTDML
jgi:hypothetical protein